MKKLIFILGVLCGFTASAQNTPPPENVGSVEVNVVDKYRANIKTALKISNQPDFGDTTTHKLPVNYSISPQMLTYNFTPKPIKPVRVSGVRLGKLPRNMITLGIGNYGTAMAEVLLSSARAQKFNWDVGLRHFSSQKGVKNIAYDKSPFMENEFYLGGRWVLRNYRVKSKIGMDWNSNSYYGIPQSVADAGTQLADLQRNAYQRYFVDLSTDKIKKRSTSVFQEAGINYQYFTNNWETHEQLLKVKSRWQMPQNIEDHVIDAGINVAWQKTEMPVSDQGLNRLHVQFFPKINGKWKRLNYTFGLNFNFLNTTTLSEIANKSSSFDTYFYPQILLEAEVVRNALFVFGGWTGHMDLNGIYDLTRQNPFVLPEVSIRPTSSNRIYAGAEGAVMKNLSYKLEGGVTYVRSMALFTRSGDVADTLFNNVRIPAFGVVYARGNYLNLRGELAYLIKNTEVSVFGEWLNYDLYLNNTGDLKQPYHLPTLKIGAQVAQNIRDKFTVNAGLIYLGGRKALNTDGAIFEADMKDIFDVNLGIGYRVNNNLSAQLNFANMLSQEYDLWLGFPAQRFRVLLSLTYKF